ncbi:RNA polymerase sigma factor [Chitinophaga vietnamensis]|uniref:RNA polymerase sigma factor n=1 Tax=Chitinophaga vietnamensis TaxID=2593957 RepID=UPI0011783205|nr:sigma-70 family RNA polymerase sigma factor [Chitinophaga vietnamensis]
MNAAHNDIELLEQLKTGSLQAFRHFYLLYRHWLILTAATILNDEEEAKELVQEFFIDWWQNALYQKIDLNSTSSLKNYLFITIKNRCLNRIAKNETLKKRYKSMVLPDDYTLPSNHLENNELRQQLDSAISKLPTKQSQVFKMAYEQQHSRKEIAIAMSISEETVKKQLASALKSLRTSLKYLFVK